MKKLFDKDEVWFAVIWIIAYVVLFSVADGLSDAIGIPKLITVAVGLIMTGVLYLFARKYKLQEYLGLCTAKGNYKSLLWFLPLAVISSVNLWGGIAVQGSATEILLYVVSMCFVGFLEEVIFRGLLFKGMAKTNVTAAVIVSSLTFGMGHAVNLLMGAPLGETLLQLVYASAVGFCFTAIFLAGGSIWPCILAHAFVNGTSVIACPQSFELQLITAGVQTAVSIAYGLWLLRVWNKDRKETADGNSDH